MIDQFTNLQICRRAILFGVVYLAAMALLGVFTIDAVTTIASR